MTVLASYTFPIGSSLSGTVVRGYATGRYVNNSGSSQTVNIRCLYGTTFLTTLSIAFNSSAAALGWILRAHFYFTQSSVQTGVQYTVGCTMEADFTNNGTLSGRTGSYVSIAPMQVKALPYINVDPTQTTMVNMQFLPAGVANEVLETGCAYLEAL